LGQVSQPFSDFYPYFIYAFCFCVFGFIGKQEKDFVCQLFFNLYLFSFFDGDAKFICEDCSAYGLFYVLS